MTEPQCCVHDNIKGYSKICKKHLRGDINRTIGQFNTLSKYYVLLLLLLLGYFDGNDVPAQAVISRMNALMSNRKQLQKELTDKTDEVNNARPRGQGSDKGV